MTGGGMHRRRLFEGRHLVLIFYCSFAGPDGLEESFAKDGTMDPCDPAQFFPHYINAFPHQYTRSIRTEEAIPISLAALVPLMRKTNGL